MSATSPTDLRRSLEDVARNYAFGWLPGARELFAGLDADAWAVSGRNPVAFLAALGPEELERRFEEPALRAEAERVHAALLDELSAPTWWDREHAAETDALVAYFSAEFGVDETLPLYSGGLGVLAGDHLKSASELGVPLVGVGLLYRGGYFRQDVDESGWQIERYPEYDPERLALTLERAPDGSPVLVHLALAGEPVAVQVWRAQVGRTPLFLLDTALEQNSPEARRISSTLYGGDRDLRLRQELVLGVGGVRALAALGLAPTVFHMNEGHSGFLAVERLRRLVSHAVPVSDALERVRASMLFTTHTPVPAGNEVFDPEHVRRYLGSTVEELGLAWDDFCALGAAGGQTGFGLTPLALRTAAYANGVSELHGSVSRRMWASVWPDRADTPIGHVTNGVHPRTWLAREVDALLRAAGEAEPEEADDYPWHAARELSDAALWAVHAERKRKLLDVARRRLGDGAALDPDALTIGFARRFATYKRGGLLLSEADRLARLLADRERPLQILVAGKSHPADDGGKEVIRRIVSFTRDERSAGRLVFLEDYDMALARLLVQGVDVWLNNPRRPYEASGTSGMKAGLNGVLNLSVLDGWWCEGYAPELGWAFGGGDGASDEVTQDARDAEELFRLLEHEVVPAFYERDGDGLPLRWLAMMKEAIARVGARFSSNRMVREYVERYYVPAHRAARRWQG